jgi:hypothetical protein
MFAVEIMPMLCSTRHHALSPGNTRRRVVSRHGSHKHHNRIDPQASGLIEGVQCSQDRLRQLVTDLDVADVTIRLFERNGEVHANALITASNSTLIDLSCPRTAGMGLSRPSS